MYQNCEGVSYPLVDILYFGREMTLQLVPSHIEGSYFYPAGLYWDTPQQEI